MDGYCRCGCGGKTKIATCSDGLTKRGEYRKYIQGHSSRGRTVDDRFDSKVRQQPNGCHIWVASKDACGYGNFSTGTRWVRAHRFSYERAYGLVPSSLYVLHKCDTPACVNPEHLFVGTQADNMQDKIAKGRSSTGGWVLSLETRNKMSVAQLGNKKALGIKKSPELRARMSEAQALRRLKERMV